MSDVFNEKEQSEEARYKLDEEQRFKIRARRNKLLGLWAAEQLALADADAYGKNLVVLDFDSAGDDNIIAKVIADGAAQGQTWEKADIARKIAELDGVAFQQISGSFPSALAGDHKPVGG